VVPVATVVLGILVLLDQRSRQGSKAGG